MTAPTPAMPEDIELINAEDIVTGYVVQRPDYDALRAYATALREENERLRKMYEGSLKAMSYLTDVEQKLEEVLKTVHQPNPANPHEWRVKHGAGIEFSKAIDAAKGDGNV